ncbi:MAG: hypothetical protein ACM31L_02595 [Actinomycetota bacterium]
MTAIWNRPGGRLDAELAVALDATARCLVRARSPRQLEQAVVYTLRLWRAVRRLAPAHPDPDRRELLRDTADHVATMLVLDPRPCPDPRDLAFIAGRCLSLAEHLAGPSAMAGARAALLGRWAADDRHDSFEEWLLGRFQSDSQAPAGANLWGAGTTPWGDPSCSRGQCA